MDLSYHKSSKLLASLSRRMERLASAQLASTPAAVAQEIATTVGVMASPGMGALTEVLDLRSVNPKRSRSLPGSPQSGSRRPHHATATPHSARAASLGNETTAHHGTCTKDAVLLQALLDKVTSLSIEKERLSDQATCLQEHSAGLQRQVAALQREKHQLSSLVLELADTLQQKQHQARLLLYLQRQRLIKAAAGSSRMAPALTPAPVAYIASQQQQQQQGCDDNDDDLAEISAALPFVGLQQQEQAQAQQQHHQQQQQQHLVDSVRNSQHRVAEWLEERGWQEWQEKLPLEPMSSASSSSLIMAVEDSMLRN